LLVNLLLKIILHDSFYSRKVTHCVDDEVGSIGGPNGIVEREHVTSNFFAEGVGNMAGNKMPDGGGNAKWASFNLSRGSLWRQKR
jgi:hypothetical protein